YVMLLAGAHALLGGNYNAITSAQVLVLALLPAVLYLLAARLHSRFAGLLLAGLVIVREVNSIALGGIINLSHAKLLMADLPAALALAAACLAAVAWLRRGPGGLAGLL